MHLNINLENMNISIKKPCHENWNEMTPNEQGAFCGKCVKTVVDFSTKTIDEIKDFFYSTTEEKVCGRFETTQLTSLSFDDFYSKFNRFKFSKRVALIICLTFGAWLFGTESALAQTKPHKQPTEIHMKGDVAYEPEKKDTAKKCVKTPPEKHMIMGKVLPPKKPIHDSTKVVPKEKHYTMGEPAVEPVKTTEKPKKVVPKKK